MIIIYKRIFSPTSPATRSRRTRTGRRDIPRRRKKWVGEQKRSSSSGTRVGDGRGERKRATTITGSAHRNAAILPTPADHGDYRRPERGSDFLAMSSGDGSRRDGWLAGGSTDQPNGRPAGNNRSAAAAAVTRTLTRAQQRTPGAGAARGAIPIQFLHTNTLRPRATYYRVRRRTTPPGPHRVQDDRSRPSLFLSLLYFISLLLFLFLFSRSLSLSLFPSA